MPDDDDRKTPGRVVAFPQGAQTGAGVASGGDGPHGPDMEARMARLEDQFSRIETLLRSIDDRVHKLEIDGSELKGRLATLPATWAMIATVIGGQMALATLLFGALRLSALH